MTQIKKIIKSKIDGFMTYFARYLMERYEMNAKLDNLKYEVADAIRREEIVFPEIISALDTIRTLIKDNKSICRFGDGEFAIMQGGVVKFQQFHPVLAERLKEIVVSNDESILIGIPDSMGSLERYRIASKEWTRIYYGYNREKIYRFLDMAKTYYDAGVTRPYLNLANKELGIQILDLFPSLWNEREVVFVEGEYTRAGVGNSLFNNAKSIERVICPNFDAFHLYDKIFDVTCKLPKEKLILIALGPTATVLAYDLAKLGYQAIDLGHLDIEYEWYKGGAKVAQSVQNKYVNESANSQAKVFAELKDERYQSQIIARIYN